MIFFKPLEYCNIMQPINRLLATPGEIISEIYSSVIIILQIITEHAIDLKTQKILDEGCILEITKDIIAPESYGIIQIITARENIKILGDVNEGWQ